MTPAPRKPRRKGRSPNRRGDLWRPVPPPPEPQPIAPAVDPTVLVRSLGPPPLPGRTTHAEHYLAAVVERAASMAAAVAAAAGTLAESDAD